MPAPPSSDSFTIPTCWSWMAKPIETHTPADAPVRPLLGLSSSSSASTRALRGSKPLHQLSKRWADSRESRALAGVQTLDGFVKYDADLWRKTSAYKGLEKSASYCFQQ